MRPDSGIEWKTSKNTYFNTIKFYSLEMRCINEIDNKFIFKSIKSKSNAMENIEWFSTWSSHGGWVVWVTDNSNSSWKYYLLCNALNLFVIPSLNQILPFLSVVTLLWSCVVNTLFTYIVLQKGYFHPFPLSMAIMSPLILHYHVVNPRLSHCNLFVIMYLKPVKITIFVIHYSDKLAHVQVVVNCQYSITQMCTCEDMLAHNLGAPYCDDIMSYNSLTTYT